MSFACVCFRWIDFSFFSVPVQNDQVSFSLLFFVVIFFFVVAFFVAGLFVVLSTVMAFSRTVTCWRRAVVTIPKLSPTHTKARIYKWYAQSGSSMECYDPIFVLECSPDLVSNGYRLYDDHKPLMIVESHEEGDLQVNEDIVSDKWYKVGDEIGTIDDGDSDDDAYNSEWLWQAYSYQDQKNRE